MKKEKILIIGGTGALGSTLTKRYYDNNNIMVLSRNEHKQEAMKVKYPNVIYRLGDVKIDYPLPQGGYMGVYYPVEQIQIKDFNLHNISSIKTFSKTRPVYTKYSTLANSIRIQIHPYPSMNSSVMINYIRKPKNPNWTYVISGGKALFSENNDFQDFELHPSEESNLVVKILQLAGVTIKDFNLVQVAGQKEVSTIQQQKQ